MSDNSEQSHRSIHHVCKTFFPLRGGVEVVVDAICRCTANAANSTVLSAATATIGQKKYPFARLKLAKSYGELLSTPLAPKIFFEIWRSLRSANVVCVHYPFPLADIAVGLAGLFARAEVVVYWHAKIYSQKLSKWFIFPFTYLMILKASKVVVASPSMLEHSAMLRHFRRKVTVLPYGLPELSESASNSHDDGYFLAIGRHVPYKGFDVLIKAFATTHHRLIIAGDGARYSDHLALVKKLGLCDRVSLLGSVSEAKKSKLLKGCTALILPSIYPSEAFALVQLEAMQFAKPIINTSLKSGVPWVARNSVESITVSPSNATELANAANRLASDDELRTRLGANGRIRRDNMFSEDMFSKRIHKLFKLHPAR